MKTRKYQVDIKFEGVLTRYFEASSKKEAKQKFIEWIKSQTNEQMLDYFMHHALIGMRRYVAKTIYPHHHLDGVFEIIRNEMGEEVEVPVTDFIQYD